MVDAGQFTARAENAAGEARSTADLVVRARGAPPGQYIHVTKVLQGTEEVKIRSDFGGKFEFLGGTGDCEQREIGRAAGC